MEAKVQYNDLRGSAVADVSDYCRNSLQVYLLNSYKGYDGERYYCEGITAYVNDSSKMVNVSFICYDKKREEYVKFIPKDYTYDRFF